MTDETHDLLVVCKPRGKRFPKFSVIVYLCRFLLFTSIKSVFRRSSTYSCLIRHLKATRKKISKIFHTYRLSCSIFIFLSRLHLSQKRSSPKESALNLEKTARLPEDRSQVLEKTFSILSRSVESKGAFDTRIPHFYRARRPTLDLRAVARRRYREIYEDPSRGDG